MGITCNKDTDLHRFTSRRFCTDCHDKHPPSIQLKEIKNLKNKLQMTQTVIRKTDKSKVFHLGNN